MCWVIAGTPTISATWCSFWCWAPTWSGTALLGASGIVFMMILLSSFGGVRNGTIPTTLILVAIFYLGDEIWNGIFVQDNISQLTHIIGGLCGTVFGFALSSGKRR